MTESSPVRIGFIGAGDICRTQHLPRLAKIRDAQVQVVCNRSEKSSKAVADAFGIPEIEMDWQALVVRDDLDAIFIGTWPYMHREMSVAALQAGKHVFCQARMASDLAEARAMVEAADAHPGQVHMICPPPHRMPWEPYIRQLLSDGELGELREVSLVCVNGSDLGDLTWREQIQYSGQQIMQLGIWAETLNAWVGQYQSLSATLATPITEKTNADGSTEEIKIPQIVLIQGTLDSGAAIIERHSGVAAHENVNTLTLTGSDATLHVDIANHRIQFARVGRTLKDAEVPDELQRPWQVEHDFIRAVQAARQGKAWHVSPDFHEGLAYMRKIEAVHRAARTRQMVQLADV